MLFAAVRTEQDLADIKAEIDEMENALEAGDPGTFSTHDRRFHELIFERCGNPILAAVGKMFQEIALEYTKMLNDNDTIAKRSQYEHQMLYWAIQDMKKYHARNLMEMHMERSREHLIELIKNRPEQTPAGETK